METAIPRYITSQIEQSLQPGKAVIIYGPRRVGKTTILQSIIRQYPNHLYVSGEDIHQQAWLGSRSINELTKYIGNTELLAIDEAQKIDQIGLNLKLIVDHIPNLKVIATGSSSFELANQVGEPLVGRKWQFNLYPIAQLELAPMEDLLTTKQNLSERLIFGSYPEVVKASNLETKVEILKSIVDNHLYKDILEFSGIKKHRKIVDLLKLIAFQVGYQVSLQELATRVNLSQQTVENYLDLLEKAFIIQRVFGFSRNLRSEITKTSRYYFLDNGIRNALINNFNNLTTRNDIGQLWENYLFIERMKKQSYQNLYSSNYFWRTYDQKEIDLVEEREGKLFGYEFKWSLSSKAKAPRKWLETYPNAEYKIINPENYLEFII